MHVWRVGELHSACVAAVANLLRAELETWLFMASPRWAVECHGASISTAHGELPGTRSKL